MSMEVYKLIDDYQMEVEEMLKLLKQKARDFENYKEIRRGVLDEKRNITFAFHGIGCLFKNDSVCIDIDFGRPRYDGIDLWFLESYWKSTKANYSYNSFENVISEINLLEKEGLLIKDIESRYLYYLKSNWDKPKSFSWE